MKKIILALTFLTTFLVGVAQEKQINNEIPPPPPPPPRILKSNTSEKEKEYRVVEQLPEYKGGRQKMVEFISKNIVYPKSALENGEEGTVYIEFLITSKGKVSKAKIKRGVSKEIDNEAKRVVLKMPKWKPGKQRGKKVNCWYVIPIKFRIN